MALAVVLGHRHLCLLGYDSSYDKGRSHAFEQPQNADYKTIPVFVEDREYQTTPMMAKQVEEFRQWLRAITALVPELDVRLFGRGLLYDYVTTGDRAVRTRETEANQYRELYEDPSYGMSEYRKNVIFQILHDRPTGALLDVGTGRGETLEMAQDLGYVTVRGTETVPALCKQDKVLFALLPNLPIGNEAFDTVTCFEVVEHLLPEDVVPALQELARVADHRVIISVCTAPDIRGGANLHPSARSEAEWEETLRVAWGDDADIRKIGNVSSNGVSPVYEVVKS
jgi:SAM-dependent methyltransferase